MKKYLAVIAVILFMVGLAYAQTPRDYRGDPNEQVYLPSEGQSVFTDITVLGLNVEGVPGYIGMMSSNGYLYYVYIDDGGNLKAASPNQVATSASPNTTDWANVGQVIGKQSE